MTTKQTWSKADSVQQQATLPPGRSAAVFWSTFTTRLMASMAQPSLLVVTAIFYFMVTAILSALWRTAVTTTGGSIVGYSATAIVWYIVATEIAIMALPPRVIEEEAELIISGRIEVELLRPANVMSTHVASWLGHALPKVFCCLAVGLVWGRLFGGQHPDLLALALAGPAVLVAIVNNVIAQVSLGGAAFWLRDVRAFWFLYQKIVFVLGGMLLPLEILPQWLETVAIRLPFMTMAYAPGRLAAGYFEPSLLVWQAFWLVVLVAVASVIYKRGIRHLGLAP